MLGITFGWLLPGIVAAQVDCATGLPDSVFTRATVFLEAGAIDTSGRRVLPAVDLLTQSVANRLRQSLGGGWDRIPAADSVVDWQRVGASLVLAVYSDGRFSWRRDGDRPFEDTARRPSRELIERALAVTRDSGERVYVADGAIPDSMLFRLSYSYPIIAQTGKIQPFRVRQGFAVFTLPLPWMKPAIATRPPRVRYPSGSRNHGAEGFLILQFIVDTTGRAVMSTVRDLWPAERPRLTGAQARYYEEFVTAATDALEDARFDPARIGGCPIRQLVQLPFGFKLRR